MSSDSSSAPRASFCRFRPTDELHGVEFIHDVRKLDSEPETQSSENVRNHCSRANSRDESEAFSQLLLETPGSGTN